MINLVDVILLWPLMLRNMYVSPDRTVIVLVFLYILSIGCLSLPPKGPSFPQHASLCGECIQHVQRVSGFEKVYLKILLYDITQKNIRIFREDMKDIFVAVKCG